MKGQDKIWRDRDITTATKQRLVKALVFPVAIYGCKAWTKSGMWRNSMHEHNSKKYVLMWLGRCSLCMLNVAHTCITRF